MVWGAIGLGFKSKVAFVDGTLNGERYCEMFMDNGICESNKTRFGHCAGYFQQDGASAHRTKDIMQFLRDQGRTITPDWLLNSPDLSVTENVWGILKSQIAARGPGSVPKLKQTVQEEWSRLSQNTINALVHSMNQRFKLCLKQDRKSIRHFVGKIHSKSRDESRNSDLSAIRLYSVNAGQAGTMVTARASVLQISDDGSDPQLQWVLLRQRGEWSHNRIVSSGVDMLISRDAIPPLMMEQTVTLTVEVVVRTPKQMKLIPSSAGQKTGLTTYLMLRRVHVSEDLGGQLPTPIDPCGQLLADIPSRKD
jgi:hypothetical protein